MRPVLKNLCKFESLKNGDLDLADFSLMNDALDVMMENQRLADEEQNRMNNNGR